jgi:hypothetical protein
MKVNVNFFKKSGKWYCLEAIEIPDEAEPWDFAKYLPKDHFENMFAVANDETPWGFPALSTIFDERGEKEIKP